MKKNKEINVAKKRKKIENHLKRQVRGKFVSKNDRQAELALAKL